MKFKSSIALRLGFALAAAYALAGSAIADTTARSVQPRAQPAAPAVVQPGTPAGTPVVDTEVAANTNTAVGGGANYNAATTARGAPQGPIVGAAGAYTPTQVAQSFLTADSNQDGELTRAEAQRLAIAPYAFEEMDRNHDGVITRFEYEDAVR